MSNLAKYKSRFVVILVALFDWWVFAAWRGDANDIVLRTWIEYQDGKYGRGDRIREWHFKTPPEILAHRYHAFLDPVFDPQRMDSDRGGQSVYFTTHIDKADAVVPYRPQPGGDPNRAFAIDMNNGALDALTPAREDFCLTTDELDRLHNQKIRDAQGLALNRCPPTNGNCSIYLNYHGWDVSVSVAREGLYRDPQKVCSILRSTLDRWTVSVDDLRVTPSKKEGSTP